MALSVPGAMAALGLGRGSIYRLLDSKQLRSLKANGRRLIPVAEIERFLAEGVAATCGEAGERGEDGDPDAA